MLEKQNTSYVTWFAHLKAFAHPYSVMFVQSPAHPPFLWKQTVYTQHFCFWHDIWCKAVQSTQNFFKSYLYLSVPYIL